MNTVKPNPNRPPLERRLMANDPTKALHAYGKLHDGLSDMIEEGRLTESDIPDDYQWLVQSLIELTRYWK